VRRWSEKYIAEGSKYAHWIGRYLSFHLSWVLGPFVHGGLQNLQKSEVTFAHVITPGNNVALPFSSPNIWVMHIIFLQMNNGSRKPYMTSLRNTFVPQVLIG